MKRKVAAAITALALAGVLAACGTAKAGSSVQSSAQSTTESGVQSSAEETAVNAEASAEKSTEQVSEPAGDETTAEAVEAATEQTTEQSAEQPAEASADRIPLDYGDAGNWIYLGTEDGEASVDVFFIAPSVFGGKEGSYTMDTGNEKAMANFAGAINMEKGIYDQNTRFYAPVYRQVGYNVYSLPEDEAKPLKDFAYADLKDAFAYYMEHLNDGRPLILAGFSQGAEMSIRLMKDCFGDENLQKQLVACYAIGWRLTPEETGEWPQLKPAKGETDTGVIITFDAEAEDVTETDIIPAGMKTLSINPLNWATDGEPADASLNLGACFTDYEGNIQDEVPALTGAYLDEERGALKVTDIDSEVYNAKLPTFGEGVYHLYDYQFFYRNLQKNVQDRIRAYH